MTTTKREWEELSLDCCLERWKSIVYMPLPTTFHNLMKALASFRSDKALGSQIRLKIRGSKEKRRGIPDAIMIDI